ncbi:MAG: iron ABC transporter permease, partial [Rickettsiales bacterium]|nr:iron ABC transporter permease [Rickettsiales bacterium]
MSPFARVSSGRTIVILSTVIVALCFIAPVGFLVLYASGDLGTKPLDHLQQTNLNLYVRNSLFLALGVAFFSVIIGTLTAWLVTFYSFPFKRILRVGLIFPLAFPSYILAITYGSSLDEAGWVQSLIRNLFDVSYGDYPFFDIRSLGGAIFVLSCSLYPYVYIMAYNSFKKQSRSLWEIAQTLGANNWQLLRRLILPISRPAIIVGVTLVIMETLADYGVVDLFGVPSFTTGIYRTWFNMHDKSGAILLSTILLLFVVVLIYVEYHQRRKVNYANENADYSPNPPKQLKGIHAYVATFICALPLVLGFLIPLVQLLYWSVLSSHTIDMMSVWNDTFNSLLVAFLSASSVIMISLLFVYALRYQHQRQKP